MFTSAYVCFMCVVVVSCWGPAADDIPKMLVFDSSRVPEPDSNRPKPLARVLSRYIYPDEADMKGPDRAGMLRRVIIDELRRRIVAEKGLVAGQQEIEKFVLAMRADDEHILSEIAKRRQVLESDRAELSEVRLKQAETAIVSWKFKKLLYEKYGGDVVFQQGAPQEPVGAYREFLKEMESQKILLIYDAGEARRFWEYFEAKKLRRIPVRDVDFARPWWEK